MVRTAPDSGSTEQNSSPAALTFQADGHDRIELPSGDFIADAKMTHDGDDLVLQAPDGAIAVVEGYFSADPAPLLHSADGATLTPNLVEAFARSPMEFAANNSANDESPVGAVEEVKGEATVTRADGTVETITAGTPIYQGDIVETKLDGAVNIVFMDETSMAVSQNARLAIDQYTFDPATESGTTNFSVLRGLFVFTSGLIGRDDPDDVSIDTPVGSIGIRGTIIAGEINPGGESNISVLEGAIVITNGTMTTTLSHQFETVRLGGFNEPMHEMGVVAASDINTKFSSVGNVLPSLFSVIHDAVQEQSAPQQNNAPASDTPSSEPEAKADPVPMQDIVTLNDHSSGLPDTQTALGQTAGTTDNHSSSPATATPAGNNSTTTSGTTAATTPVVDTPVNPVVTGNHNTDPVTPTAPLPFILDANAAGVTVITDTTDNYAGFSVAGLGDVDHDGFDDLIFSNNSQTAGQNHLYQLNGTSGYAADGTIPSLMGSGAMDTISNPANTAGTDLQTVVTGIGDFNGDGHSDYAIGQSGANTGATNAGNAYIVNGADTNLSLTFTSGGNSGDGIGSSISGIGDFNNDGYADVVIGAPNAANGFGSAFLAMGASTTSWTSNLNSLAPISGGVNNTSNFGSSVEGIGDINGDGYSDFAVGAAGGNGYLDIMYGFKTGSTPPSSTRISGGAAEGLGAEIISLGDINGDGYSDLMAAGTGNTGLIVLGGTMNQTTYNLNESGSDYELSGGGAVGDFNGDGFDDYALSIADDTQTKIYVVFGKEGALAPTITLDYLKDSHNAFEMTYSGADKNDDMLEISGVGDLNGDGRDDFAIGVPDANGSQTGDGGVILVYGRDTGDTPVKTTATENNDSLVGTAAQNTMDDNGFAQTSFHAGAGDDVIWISNTNFRNIDGGGSTANGGDTILVDTGAGGALNFSNINFEQISGIEKIQFGQDAQTLTLTMENIFNLLKSSDGYSNGTNNYSGFLQISANGSGDKLAIDLDPASATDSVAGAVNTVTDLQNALQNYAGTGTTVTHTTEGNFESFKIGGYMLMIENTITLDIQ